jgi:hypothetical protein
MRPYIYGVLYRGDADFAIAAYLDTWDKSVREFYSPQNFNAPLDVVKHCQSAIRFAVNCYSMMNGRERPKYEPAADILAKLRVH